MKGKSTFAICEEICIEECSLPGLSLDAYTECVNACMKTCIAKHFGG